MAPSFVVSLEEVQIELGDVCSGTRQALPLPVLAGSLVVAYCIMRLRVGGRGIFRLCAKINFAIFFPE